jgi:hypothetical protein
VVSFGVDVPKDGHANLRRSELEEDIKAAVAEATM